MRELHIAAYGLNHPEWEGSYYPDGLPPEWRLDFYANRFPALLLPTSEWLSDDLADWLEELREGYPLYLLVDDAASWPLLLGVIERLGDHFAGVVLKSGIDPTPFSERGIPWGREGEASPLALARVRGDVESMALRRSIESLMEGEGKALLCIDGAPGEAPRISTLEQAQTLAGLMGLL